MNALHPQHSKLRIWAERLLYVLMVAFATVSVWLLVVVIYDAYFDNPPIHIVPVHGEYNPTVCPEDILPIENRIEVYEPTVLTLYVSVMDNGYNQNIPGTSAVLLPRLHPKPASLDQVIPWSVPHLEPGTYTRVVAIRGHDDGQNPLFVFTKFTIGEGCS